MFAVGSDNVSRNSSPSPLPSPRLSISKTRHTSLSGIEWNLLEKQKPWCSIWLTKARLFANVHLLDKDYTNVRVLWMEILNTKTMLCSWLDTAQSALQTPLRKLSFGNGSLKIRSTSLGVCIWLFFEKFLFKFLFSHKRFQMGQKMYSYQLYIL